MCCLKDFGTQISVLSEIFFKQALNIYAAGLLLFLFELYTVLRTGKEKCQTEVCQLATHPHLHCNVSLPVLCYWITAVNR